MTEVANTYCEHCGASLKKYWYKITPVLVNILIVILEKVKEKDQNFVETKELYARLKPYECTQLTKLRFHGLIAKHKVEGVQDGWLITKRGGQFLRGEIEIPVRVLTFRNVIEDHDPRTIGYKALMRQEPYYETYRTLDYELHPQSNSQEALF